MNESCIISELGSVQFSSACPDNNRARAHGPLHLHHQPAFRKKGAGEGLKKTRAHVSICGQLLWTETNLFCNCYMEQKMVIIRDIH